MRRLELCVGGDVGIGVQREARGVVAEHTADRFHVHAVLQGHGGKGVTEIVESDAGQRSPFQHPLEHMQNAVRRHGASGGRWEYPLAISNLNRYSEVVDQIKETKRERTDLLAEKKELPFWNIPRKNELTARIAELTELLEELQSEKAILLDNMDCTDGKDVSKVRKKVALMEANLKELDEQEQKYSAELETALAEYAELKTQGEQFDPVELHDTRQELRPEMEQTAVQRVKEKYGDKYSHRTMDDSKRDVSRHLDEYAESQEIRQIQREREYQQRRQNKAKQERKKQDDWER